MLRTDIIQSFITKRNYKSYLEIGTYRNVNFDKITIDNKVSIDPDPEAKATYQMTSDEFFAVNQDKFDIVFIDGLHEHNQVYKDIQNSLKFLNPNGVIILHDCMPKNEKMQLWDNKSHQFEEWTGDTWKAYYKALNEINYKVYVLDTDYGCGVIDTSKPKPKLAHIVDMEELTYQDYLNLKEENKYNIVNPNSWSV
jgi:SAM-dependent methyltransferase